MRLFSAVETAENIMNEWLDDEDNEFDIVLLPLSKVDSLTDDEDIDEDQIDMQGMPNEVCGSIQIQTNRPVFSKAMEPKHQILHKYRSYKLYHEIQQTHGWCGQPRCNGRGLQNRCSRQEVVLTSLLYINTIDVLKSAPFKVYKLANPFEQIDFLALTTRIVMHYLKLAKLNKQLLPNVIYPGKRSWKDNEPVAVNEETHCQHYFEKCLQKRC